MTNQRPANPTPRPDDDMVHTSTLVLLCDGDEPPQPFDVEHRLSEAGFELAEDTGAEAEGDGVLWTRFRGQGEGRQPLALYCVRRHESFEPWRGSTARWRDEEHFERVRRSRWLIFLETVYRPGADPLLEYHHHLKLAAAVASGMAVACHDMDAMRLRSDLNLHDLASSGIPPGPDELFSIHAVHDGRHAWLHTHGLRRFDKPDLEMLRVPIDDAEVATHALQWLPVFLMDEDVPTAGRNVEFGTGLHATLAPLEELLPRLDDDEIGGSRDRDEPEHQGWRLVIVDRQPKRSRKLICEKLVKALRADPAFWVSATEETRQARLARERFGLAATAFLSERFVEKRLTVKLAAPTRMNGDEITAEFADGDEAEHMWFEVLKIKDRRLHARLESEPVYATWMKTGETYRVPLTRLAGFHLLIDGEMYTPANVTDLDRSSLRPGLRRDDE